MGNNKYKILIVEDEANIRSFIKANLETSDYQVLCAETCALGIMMYASHRPDLIVLDLGLPDRDGLDLIQKVRESDTVPIIVLSARSNERDKVEALDLGANDYITKPFGNLVVDIGAGTSDVAVISLAGVVVSASVKVAGDTFNQAILNYVRKNHGLFIGEDMAEKIKIQIGTAIEESNPRTMEVKGRNVITGLPKTVTLTSEEIRVALKDATSQIVETVHGILEKTPPELAADIVDRGIVLTGGGALLHGMDTLIEQRTGVSTLTVQDAMSVVAVGTGKYAEVMARFDG